MPTRPQHLEATAPVELRLLGPLQVGVAGHDVVVGSRKQRLLLLRLAAECGRDVAVDELVEAIWPDVPPPTAGKGLQVLVGRVRRVLEPSRADDARWQVLVSGTAGYRLAADAVVIDSEWFERGLDQARRLHSAGSLREARQLLDALLARWRGPALLDAGDAAWAQDARARLEECRHAAACASIELAIAVGDGTAVLSRAAELVAAHPHDERVRALHVAALLGAGRDDDARVALDTAQHVLAQELGLAPGGCLREVTTVLAGAASLEDLFGVPAAEDGELRGCSDPISHACSGDVRAASLVGDDWVRVETVLARGAEGGLDPVNVLDELEQLVESGQLRRRRDESGDAWLRGGPGGGS